MDVPQIIENEDDLPFPDEDDDTVLPWEQPEDDGA